VSTQLTHLQAVHAQLVRDREEFQDQADAVAAEQRRLQAEIATAQSTATALADERRTLEERLVQAGRALEQVMAERDDAARQFAVLAERLAEAQARTAASDAASDAAQHALEAACRERDETLFALLRSEQDRVHDAAQQQSETDHLAAAAAGLAHELTELRHSSSWRVTAPMRWLKDAELRRRARP
jgi:chromosome segregation ATPase